MDQWKSSLATVILGLTITIASTQSGVADGTNAQAPSLGSGGSSGGAGDSGSAPHVMRRYVPQFVGKRESELSSAEIAAASSTEHSKDQELDKSDSDIDFEDFWKNYENYDSEYDQNYNPDDSNYDSLEEMTELGNYSDLDSDESDSSGLSEEKRYVPSFVGKRDSMEEDKRYRPMFVGKRYRPMFVGKRYQPMFVGKRYQPMFVGKRYQPMFVGKRYQPMFVGKRYRPMFVGKRYQPMFVGKRYQPAFVGKRYQPQFVGKRYRPMFVGKRYRPMFVGKRYKPMFVGKRSSSEEHDSILDLSSEPLSLEKRSTESTSSQDTASPQTRHKRSLGYSDEYKRAWGRYIPWQEMVLRSEQPFEKRFVAPEFIGRRDSISSILSALKALKLARTAPRLETKRFQAPLFVGKRDQEPSDDLLWSRYDNSALNDDAIWDDLGLARDFH